jgi:putative nucleotidyltransferase with HDIG domain
MAFLPKNILKSDTTGLDKIKDNVFIKAAIGLALLILVSLMYPSKESLQFDYKVGSIWTDKDLIAPFDFPILKDEGQYATEKSAAASTVYKVFHSNEKLIYSQIESLKSQTDYLRIISKLQKRQKQNLNLEDSSLLAIAFKQLPKSLAAQDFEILNTIPKIEEWRSVLTQIYQETVSRGVLDLTYEQIGKDQIAIRKGTSETIVSVYNFYSIDSAAKTLEKSIYKHFGENGISNLSIKILMQIFHPNLTFNKIETEKLIATAIENVPRTVGFVKENERVISRHDRITPEVKLKLDSYYKANEIMGGSQTTVLKDIGIFLHSTLILALYSIYLFLFRKKIFHNNLQLSIIATLILLQAFLAYLSLRINLDVPIQYLIFVPASAMLLTIIFDSRVAFYGTVVIAFLLAAIRGNDYDIAFASLIAGALAAYTVRDIKHRTQIFRSLIFIIIGYALSIVALNLQRGEGISVMLQGFLFAFANAVFSPVLTYGLLIFFEKAFRVTTDLTLLELSDQNHPLLKLLREKAPGTFHHSILISNLAEAAADSIHANSTLARIGGYYHDIGKSLKPEYFKENETEKKSRHQRLTTRMSSLILISHVKEGIDLAREYKLPEVVVDFIPQHHGTTRISFFYDKALKQAAARKTKTEVREEDYCYPGPKPQSKEAGIVMLADVVEAYARTLDDPDPDKLESAIDDRIKMRFIEGQLDECELTLRDLTKIKEAFLNILTGIYHQRVEYPEDETQEATLAIEQSTNELVETSEPLVETQPEVKPSELQKPNSEAQPALTISQESKEESESAPMDERTS